MFDDLNAGFFHTKPRKRPVDGALTAVCVIIVSAGIIALGTTLADAIGRVPADCLVCM
ncbi:MAG: hypothetical protein AAAB35_13745 [Phyllobacterium sp.]|uniref:hypothetical protein n=1 Tax=Phyllobacterium sp. TaxID=1871046 RepID=UPI0030F1AD1A